MFGRFKRNPAAKLEAEYKQLLEAARDLQRKGDIKGFAAMTARAEAVAEKLDATKKAKD